MQKKVGVVARLILGLIFFVFGLNFFLNFIPMPPPSEASQKLMGALFGIGYLFPLVKTLEVVCGLLLISGFFVPLALLILAPIVVNIACIHFLIDTSGAPMAALLLVLGLVTAWSYRSTFAPLLKAKN